MFQLIQQQQKILSTCFRISFWLIQLFRTKEAKFRLNNEISLSGLDEESEFQASNGYCSELW